MTLSPLKKKITLALILFVAFLDYMGVGFVYPMFSSMLFSPGSIFGNIMSDTTKGLYLGLLLSVPAIFTFFSSPILGALSDQKGRRPLYIFSLSLVILGYGVCITGVETASIFILICGRLLIGIADGNAAVIGATIVDISPDSSSKVKYFGLQAMARGIGFAIGPILGGLFSKISFSLPFWIAGLATLINLLLILFFLKETNIQRKFTKIHLTEGIKNFKKAFSTADLRILFLTVIFFCMGWSLFYEFLPVTLISDFGFDTTQIGFVFAYGSLFYSLTSGLLLRWVINHFKPYTIIFYSLVALGFCMMLSIFLRYNFLIWFYIPLINFFVALPVPIYAGIVSDSVDKNSQGEILGLLQSVQTVAFGLSPLLAGFLVGINVHAPMFMGSIGLFISAILIHAFFKKRISLNH